MAKPVRPEVYEFHRQLITYQLIMERNQTRLEADIWLARQISFWKESARFCITELEIWDEAGDGSEFNRTLARVRQAFDHLYELFRQLP